MFHEIKVFHKVLFSVLMISFLDSYLGFSTAKAQQFKVEKVKGNKAVIEYSGTSLSPGGTYSIGGANSEEGSSPGGSRKYVIGGSVSLEFFTNTSSVSSNSSKDNSLHFLGRFGWNLEHYEIGLLAGYTNTETDTSIYSAIKGGAFLDYNLTPNRPGENTIFGISGEGSYTSITSSTGGSGMGLYASGFAKWFVLGPSTALRLDLGYNYEKGSFSSYSTTTQGFDLRGGVATYF